MTSTLASHILVVYTAMEKEAVERDDLKIYTGSLARMMKELGISGTYYSEIFRTLYDNGYCALGERGGRNKPSTVILVRRPERDELLDLTSEDGEATVSLVNRVETLETSVGGLNIVTALAEIERRLVALEGQERKTNGKAKK
jgi:hypothetical protein